MNFKLLKNKNLSLLVLGQFVSQFGSGMQSFAFSLYVLSLTGSGTQFASVLAVSMVPRLVLGPICGVFADWFDRKKIIVYLDLLSGLIIGALYIISITSTLSMLHIYTTVIILSVISSLFSPAIGTAIPSVVDKEDLMGANSLNRLALTICYMLYPIVAGAVFGLFGISVVLLLNAVSFILSAVSEMFIDLKSPVKKRSEISYKAFRNDFKAGVQLITNHKLIKNILLLSITSNAVLSPSFSVGLIYVANMVLKITDFQLGILQTLMVCGTLTGSIFAGLIGKKVKLEKVLYLAVIALGVLVCSMAFNSSSYYLSFFDGNLVPYITLALLSLLATSIGVITNIGMSTLMQKEVPLDMMGRVSSVKETISMAAVPMGQIVFGIVFDNVASYIPLLISGIIVIAAATMFNYTMNKEVVIEESLETGRPLLDIK